jgi:hypothetical protein
MSTASPEETAQAVSTTAETVSGLALKYLSQWLRDAYGSDLSRFHTDALRAMLDTFARLTFKLDTGRIAIPLPAGAGKSLGIIAYLTALHELDPQHPDGGSYSVTVAASHVENLTALIRDFKMFSATSGKGSVPDAKVGLLHSKLYSEEKMRSAMEGESVKYASMPKTEGNDARPFLFTTHARLETGEDPQRKKRAFLLTTYHGRQRDVVLWDEGCIPTDTWVIPRSEVRSYIAGLPYRLEDDRNTDGLKPIREKAAEYLTSCLPYLDFNGDPMRRFVCLPEPAEVGVEEVGLEVMSDALSALSLPDSVGSFLQTAWKPLRIYRGNGSKSDAPACLTFDLSIPRQLDRMAILDASFPIRILEHLDSSIRLPVDTEGNPHPAFSDDSLAKIKDHSTVKVHVIKHGGGRRGITKALSDKPWNRKKAGQLSAEIAEIIRSKVPEEEKVLVVTFNTREKGRYTVDIVGTLHRDLEALGIDVARRVSFLTWGNHTSLNKFRDYKYGILAGVLQRSGSDLLTSILAAQGDIDADVSKSSVNTVGLSESTHDCYQAINRSACRKIVLGPDGLGYAHAAEWWVVYQDPKKLRRELKRIMPGIDCEESHENLALPTPERKGFPIAKAVAEHLSSLPPTVDYVSSVSVKRNAGDGWLLRAPHMTFARAVQQDLSRFTSEWTFKKGGRGFVRVRQGDV